MENQQTQPFSTERLREVLVAKNENEEKIVQIEQVLAASQDYLNPACVEGWLNQVSAGGMTTDNFLMALLQRRQGDVYLIPRLEDGKPAPLAMEALTKQYKRSTQPVALGEITGHHHVVTQVRDGEQLPLDQLGDQDTVLYVDAEGNMILRAKEGTALQHVVEQTGKMADHSPVEVVPGFDYDVKIQKEYTPVGYIDVTD